MIFSGSKTKYVFLPLIHTGEKWLYGCWFYRPNETFHLATRKFLEKEVFKSDYYNKAPVSKIMGKCVVMFVKVIHCFFVLFRLIIGFVLWPFFVLFIVLNAFFIEGILQASS